ncbi:hypothetical protein [Lusitaniella coriacea]
MTDAENRLVSVLIDYDDWQKIEKWLIAHQSQEETAESQLPQLEVNWTI